MHKWQDSVNSCEKREEAVAMWLNHDQEGKLVAALWLRLRGITGWKKCYGDVVETDEGLLGKCNWVEIITGGECWLNLDKDIDKKDVVRVRPNNFIKLFYKISTWKLVASIMFE